MSKADMGGAAGFRHPSIPYSRKQTPPLAGAVAMLAFIAGCDMPAGMNTDCVWPPALSAELSAPVSQAAPVDASHRSTDRRQLQYRIRVAEELAMRYADARGKLAHDYLERRNGCESTLLKQLARHQKVSVSEIADARSALSEWHFDPAVYLPVLVLCLGGAFLVGGVIHRRFSHDERLAIMLATVIASLAFGWLVTILGDMWGGVVEMIRLGNTHMAYRVTRIGWRERAGEAFVLTALLCSLLIMSASRMSRPRSGIDL